VKDDSEALYCELIKASTVLFAAGTQRKLLLSHMSRSMTYKVSLAHSLIWLRIERPVNNWQDMSDISNGGRPVDDWQDMSDISNGGESFF
jgi:hypothetical protein